MKSIKSFIISLIAVSILGVSPMAMAAAWQYPDEISVSEAYNKIFFTSYDETTTEGLAALVSEHGGAMEATWTTETVQRVTVLAMETSSTSSIGIEVNGQFLEITDPGPWTSPSRGWLNDPLDSNSWSSGIVDIAQLLSDNGYSTSAHFKFVVGNVDLEDVNTHRLEGNDTNTGFLLAHNEGGLGSGDNDANEPIIYVNPPNSVPGSCGGMAPTIVGTPGRDVFDGTSGDDIIHALGGNDVIEGGSGNDIMCGGDGDDVLEGKSGDDTVIGHFGDDRLFGNGGDDVVQGDEGEDTVRGNSGNDTLSGGPDADRMIGDSGMDDLQGDGGDDRIYAGIGDDDLDGGDGSDVCDGGGGTDTVVNCERVLRSEIVN